MKSEVRGFNQDDWPWIVSLGGANETETGPLDEAKLREMSGEACLTLAIERDAFLIAFNQDSLYDSPNFLWLRERYADFVYVDRIVVAGKARAKGLGRALYEHVIA
jgi:predicted GNAT superfamily acetyltransferase